MLKFCLVIVISALTIVSCKPSVKPVNENTKETVSLLSALTDSLVHDSLNVQLLNHRALYYIQEHQLNNALADLNKALKINPKEPELFLTLAEIYYQLKKNENCSGALLKALELNPQEIEAYNKLTQLNLLMQRFDIALGYSEKSMGIDQYNYNTLYIRGLVFLARQDTASAMRNFLLSNDMKNDFYEALMQIGAIYSKQHNPLAEDYLKKAVFRFPESAQARYEYALYLQDNGSPNKAMAQYDSLLILFPVNKFVLFNIGYLYLVYDQQFDSALYYFDRSLVIDPHYVEALYNKGRTLEEMGKLVAAKEIYQDVLKNSTNYSLAIEALNRIDKRK